MWTGTEGSKVDLHPSGFVSSVAQDVAEDYQVGWGRMGNAVSPAHALLWSGTAASVVDLHSSLADLPVVLTSSQAYAIDEDGTIVGLGRFSSHTYAIMWTPVPGDYSGNGKIDAADYTVWRDTLGQMVAAGSGADGSGNGKVDQDDYTVWKTIFAGGAGSGSIASAVPEPISWIAMCCGVVTAGPLSAVGGIGIRARSACRFCRRARRRSG